MTLPASHPLSVVVREAGPDDIPDVTAIYAHYVANTAASFEEEPPAAEEMLRRLEAVRARGLPFLVAEHDGRVLGFAYAGPFRTRSAYRYTIEDSIYVAPDAVRRGIGSALLSRLIERCSELGYRQMIAVIGDSENLSSIGLHASLGFRQEGVLRGVGWKFGRWVDVVIMHRPLGPARED